MLAADPLVVPAIDVVEELIEKGDEAVWVRQRAVAVVDAVRVRHVVAVVGRVEVDAVPA